eukprot:3120112-Rhodomonas_salina.4
MICGSDMCAAARLRPARATSSTARVRWYAPPCARAARPVAESAVLPQVMIRADAVNNRMTYLKVSSRAFAMQRPARTYGCDMALRICCATWVPEALASDADIGRVRAPGTGQICSLLAMSAPQRVLPTQVACLPMRALCDLQY